MAANVGFFQYPSKHEMKPFRCSFMDGVMLRGFLLRGFGQLLVDLTSYTFPPHWLNVFPSVKVVFFLLEYCNIMALFHQELNQELKDPFRFVSTSKLRIQKITFLLKMQFFLEVKQ